MGLSVAGVIRVGVMMVSLVCSRESGVRWKGGGG